MWGSPQKTFFNPFDKTIAKNIQEEFATLLDLNEAVPKAAPVFDETLNNLND
jgi:hypothetical protein